MGDGVDGEGDAVLHAYFAHQFCYVSFYGALFYAQGGADFFVGTAGYQHLENFLLAVGKGDPAGGEDAAGGCADTFGESRGDAGRSPYLALMHDAGSLYELGGGGCPQPGRLCARGGGRYG